MHINKINTYKIPFLITVFLLLAFQLKAQSLRTTVSANTVSIGEQFEISFEANGSASDFKIPSFEGFRKVGGPNKSSSMSYINGTMTRKISLGYVLMPIKEGTFKIPGAEAKIKDKVVKSNAVTIVVTGKSEQAKNIENELRKRIYLKSYISNSNPYIGESVIVTYKLYLGYDIRDYDVTAFPTFKGFWSKDLTPKSNNETTENINGIPFRVFTLKKHLLIPQKYGKITLDKMTFHCSVNLPTNRVDQFRRRITRPYQMETSTLNRVINIKKLPNAPKDYIGAVGDFKITNKLSVDSANVNETISLTQKISGKGNLKLFSLPKIKFLKDIESFDPKQNNKITENSAGMKGYKENQYLLVPRHPGTHKIEIPSFSYFNPKLKKYITNPAITKTIKVGGKADANYINSSTSKNTPEQVDKESVGILNNDILYISETTDLSKEKTSFYLSSLFWILLLIPIIGTVLFIIIQNITNNKIVDEISVKNKKAKKIAKKRLSESKKHLDNNSSAFYTSINDSLIGYIKDKFNLQNSELQNDKIIDLFKDNDLSENIQEKYTKIIETCQMASYAGFNTTEKTNLLQDTEELIEQLEKELA